MSDDLSAVPPYEKVIQERFRLNADEVLAFAQGKGTKEQLSNFRQKVASFSSNFGFDEEEVIRQIQSHRMFRATFSTLPRRQNIDEKTFESWLSSLDQTQDVRKLPTHDNNALYVSSDGHLLYGSAMRGKSRPSKSLDFTWITGSTTFYAMHKRTTHEKGGGAQGSVEKEMERILQNFLSCSEANIVLVLVLDGSFWTEARLDKLRNSTRDKDPKSYVVNSEGLIPILKNYV